MVHDQAPIVIPVEFQVNEVTTAPFDMVVTSDGGLVLAWGNLFATKLDTDNSVIWHKTILTSPDSLFVETLAAGLDGEVFLGGNGWVAAAPEPLAGGAGDAVVGKLAASGDISWWRQWGTSGLEWTTTLLPTEDGGVIGTGICSEQIAGAPVENHRGPVLFQYEADGARPWIRQHTPLTTTEGLHIDNLRDGIVLDATGGGRIYSSGSFHQRSVDAEGLETAASEPPAPPAGPRAYGAIRRIPGDRLLAYTPSRADASSRTMPALAAFDLDGTLKWYRQAEVESAVIDQAAGTTWTGEWLPPGRGDSMVVGADAVYVVGSYLSSYENGPTEQLFSSAVAKYDFTGNRLWFRLFRPATQNSPTWVAHYLDLGTDGNPVYALGESGEAPYVVRLSAEDGTILAR